MHVHLHSETGAQSVYLTDTADIHRYLLFRGKRITPSMDSYAAPNALIQTHVGMNVYVGQVHDIFSHTQKGVDGRRVLLYVKWFKPLRPGVLDANFWAA